MKIVTLAAIPLALATLCAAQSARPSTQTTYQLAASLRPRPSLTWQRTSPNVNHVDGPVLYQLLFRASNVQVGHLIGVGPSHNFISSLISDNGSSVAISNLSINGSNGIISWAPGQTFPAPGGGSFLPMTGGTLTGGLGGTSGAFSGAVSASSFSGNGSALTNVNATLFNGQAATWYQARVTGTCPPLSSISSINPDGTVSCGSVSPPAGNTISNVTGNGANFSVALGSDGKAIAAGIISAGAEFLHCADILCTSTTTVSLDTSSSFATGGVSVIPGTDGFPLLSYQTKQSNTVGVLRVAHCSDATCTAAPTMTTIDSAFSQLVGQYSSIAIGADSFGVISYQDGNLHLKVAHCSNTQCTATDAKTIVDPTTNTGYQTNITIGTDGFPIIAYEITGNPAILKVAHCADVACATAPTITTVTTQANGIGINQLTIAIGSDGMPAISFPGDPAFVGQLQFAHCSNVACTASTITTIDGTGPDGLNTMSIGNDGNPIILYQTFSGALSAAHCTSPTCSSFSTAIADVKALLPGGGEGDVFQIGVNLVDECGPFGSWEESLFLALDVGG
jgi:hypothetical protein